MCANPARALTGRSAPTLQSPPGMMARALGIVALVLLVMFACGKDDKAGKEGAAAAGSAKPTPGDACSTDAERVCLSPEQQAICQGGQWRSFPCAGPDACASGGGTTTCDISGNKPDDNCAAADNGKSVCGAGGKERVRCVDGKIERQMCRGPKGCTENGDETTCDMSINTAGEACTHEGTASCSLDQKEQLTCKNGQWLAVAKCRGAGGCYLSPENQIACDQSIGVKGEVCFQEGTGACTPDRRAEVICKHGRFAYYTSGCRY
jgi:hypothetical protein